MKRRAAAKLPPVADGSSLLDYLSSRFNYHSRQEWQKRIANGELALNNVIISDPEQILKCGDFLEYKPQDLHEPAVNSNYTIVYEDETLLVIDKPGNLPVHPAGAYFENTLWALLQKNNGGKVHFVNRLDRETSGLMIAAKTSDAAGKIAKTLPDMLKRYYVAVHGNFSGECTATGFLVKDERSIIRKKQRFIASGEFDPAIYSNAVTAETRLSALRGNDRFTLVSAELFTGRMHQIRATLYSMGFPVAGDKLYGLDEQFYLRLADDTLSAEDRIKLVLSRQALHCAELEFEHPASGKILHFASELPAEISALFA